jgi:hypothetical protein
MQFFLILSALLLVACNNYHNPTAASLIGKSPPDVATTLGILPGEKPTAPLRPIALAHPAVRSESYYVPQYGPGSSVGQAGMYLFEIHYDAKDICVFAHRYHLD